MPYKLRGNCVVKSDTGAVVKCHDDHASAVAHLRALYVNVVDPERKAEMKQPSRAKRAPKIRP